MTHPCHATAPLCALLHPLFTPCWCHLTLCSGYSLERRHKQKRVHPCRVQYHLHGSNRCNGQIIGCLTLSMWMSWPVLAVLSWEGVQHIQVRPVVPVQCHGHPSRTRGWRGGKERIKIYTKGKLSSKHCRGGVALDAHARSKQY